MKLLVPTLLKSSEVELSDDVRDKARKMIVRQPLLNARRKQEQRIPIKRPKMIAHRSIVPGFHSQNPTGS
jgi:hypothetical protein